MLQTAIAATKAGDPLAPVTVIPPGNHSGLDVRRRLGRQAGLINVRFMVLARLAEFVGVARLPPGVARPLTQPVRLEAVRTALAIGGPPFDAVASHPSTVSAMDAAFRELDEIPAHEVEALAGGGARSVAVVRLYREFRRITRAYYGRAELFAAASEAVAEGTGSLRDIGHVVLFLPGAMPPGRSDFLVALARANRLSAVVCVALENDDLAGQIAPFLDTATRPGPAATPVASRIVTATDPDEEVRTVLALMLRAMEEGTPAHRIACYYASEEGYRRLLAEQLAASGVPFNEPTGPSAGSTPAGRLAVGLLRLAAAGISRRALLDWLSSAPVRDAGSFVPVRIWSRLTRDAGIVGGPAVRWRASLDHHASELARRRVDAQHQGRDGAAEGFEREIASCASLASFVEDLESSLNTAPTMAWRDWTSWLSNLLDRYLDRMALEHAGSGASLETMDRALAELAGLDGLEGAEPVTVETFRAAVVQALVTPLPPAHRFGTGVFVAPLRLSAGLFFDETFVVGAVEGQLPGAEREDPLLSDGDRARAASLDQSPHRTRRLRSTYLAALAGAPRSTLSYPEANLRMGRKQLPSRWLLESASAHEGQLVDAETFKRLRDRPWLVREVSMTARLVSGLPLLTESEYRLAAIRRDRSPDVVARRTPILAGAIELVRARRSARFTRFDGFAGPAAAPGAPARVSPTRFERWARCPFQHFAGDVLRIAEFDEPEEVEVLSALDRGSIIHDVLDRFYTEAAGRAPGAWTATERLRLSALAEEECDRYEAMGRTGHGALWNMEKARILSDLAEFLDTDEARAAEVGTRFHASEVEFGGTENSLPPVVINTPGGVNLEFRGRIDRVDAGPSGDYWVYDYKTGSTYGLERLQADPLLGGRRLQLPVYARAVREGMGATGVRAAYWFVSNVQAPQFYEVPVDDATMQRLEAVVGMVSDGIAGGMFVPHPGRDKGNCQFCPYDSLCVADRERAFGRKASDERVHGYIALTEAEA